MSIIKIDNKQSSFTPLRAIYPVGATAFCFILFLLLGCGSNKCKIDKDMCEANGLDETYCPKVDTLLKPLDPPVIKRVNIFFDASGSMAGYMPVTKPSSEFQIIIPDIISQLKTQYQKVTFYPIYNSNSPMKPLNIEEAGDKIIYGTLTQNKGDTYLPSMLDSIYTNYLSPDAVNIFISDCIYSPNGKEKKKTDQATKEIREGIANRTKDFYTSVFCLRSKYLQVLSSPYYLILFGKPENNHVIEDIVLKSLEDKNQKFDEVNYGLRYSAPYYSVLPYTNKSDNFIGNPCSNQNGSYLNLTVQDWNAKNDSMSFWIGIDLRNYPGYSTTQNYLDSNLILTSEKSVSRILSISNHPPKELGNDDKSIAQRSSHFIHIKVSQFDDCVGVLHLSLQFSEPDWINQLNQDSTERNGEKTFGLKKMMAGFHHAYYPEGKAYFFNNLNVSLIKQ